MHDHQIVGVTAIGNESFRRLSDTRHLLDVYDANTNDVFDAIEYDFSGGAAAYMVDNVTITRVGHETLGPIPYHGSGDSPFDLAGLGDSFFIEDFEDGQLNTPGVSSFDGSVFGPGSTVDSVDPGGRSYYSGVGNPGITFNFADSPTQVGIVWTDGSGETYFEAFDRFGNSLAALGPYTLADDSYAGTTADDHFFGVIDERGIGSIRIWNTSGGIEVDHLQYNRPATPVVSGDRPGDGGTTHAMAYDGDVATFFDSTYDNWQYVQIDTRAVGELSALRRNMSRDGSDTSGHRGIQGETVSYSLDGANWTSLTGDTTNGWQRYVNYGATNQAWRSVEYGWTNWLNLNTPVQARYVRFGWDDASDALHEIELVFTGATPVTKQAAKAAEEEHPDTPISVAEQVDTIGGAGNDLVEEGSKIPQEIPRAQTLWTFMDEYSGADKVTRLLSSYAVANINGCTGTMISPHILITAAHCGGLPTSTVRFFRTDEDAPRPHPQYQGYSEPYYAHVFPWQDDRLAGRRHLAVVGGGRLGRDSAGREVRLLGAEHRGGERG